MEQVAPWATLVGGVLISGFVAVTSFLHNRRGVSGKESELKSADRRDTVADRDALIQTMQEERDRADANLAAERRYVGKLRRQLKAAGHEPDERD